MRVTSIYMLIKDKRFEDEMVAVKINDHPRLIKLRNDVYSLPVDSDYKRALLQSIETYGEDILKRPEYPTAEGWDDLEAIQQVTLGDSMEHLLASGAIGGANIKPTDCLFCQKNLCDHLIADIAVTEGQIRSGLVLDYIEYIHDIDTDELKESLEITDNIDFHYYEVDEGSGTWEYAKFWSRVPKESLDSIFIKNKSTASQV